MMLNTKDLFAMSDHEQRCQLRTAVEGWRRMQAHLQGDREWPQWLRDLDQVADELLAAIHTREVERDRQILASMGRRD